MRGSPLLRTILILAALVVSGLGFVRLTHKEAPPLGRSDDAKREDANVSRIPAKVYLSLSGLPGFVSLKVGDQEVTLHNDQHADFSGSVSIEPDHAVVFLKVACASPSPRIFAKLVVEAEGMETFTHVFDATGDIDDFVELPF